MLAYTGSTPDIEMTPEEQVREKNEDLLTAAGWGLQDNSASLGGGERCLQGLGSLARRP